jgi:hypothetical protein
LAFKPYSLSYNIYIESKKNEKCPVVIEVQGQETRREMKLRKSMIRLPAALPLRLLAERPRRMLMLSDWNRKMPMQSNWHRRKLMPLMLRDLRRSRLMLSNWHRRRLMQLMLQVWHRRRLMLLGNWSFSVAEISSEKLELKANSYLQTYLYVILLIILTLLPLQPHPLRWGLIESLAPSIELIL